MTGNAEKGDDYPKKDAPAKLVGTQKSKDGRNLDTLDHEEQDDEDPEDIDDLLDTQMDDHKNPKHGPAELASYGKKLGIKTRNQDGASPIMAYNPGGGFGPGGGPDAHGMSKHAAGRSLMCEEPGCRKHALNALDFSSKGKSEKAAGAHLEAAAGHEDEATEARKRGDGAGAEAHDDAAAMHRKAASMHSATLNFEGGTGMGVSREQFQGIIANCGCDRTRNALQAILNTSDESGSGSDTDQAGGEEESEEGEDSEYKSKTPIKTGAKVGGGKLAGKKTIENASTDPVEAWFDQVEAPEAVRNSHRQQKLQLVRYLVANVDDSKQRKFLGDSMMRKSVEELQQLTALFPPRRDVPNEDREPAALFIGAAGGPIGNVASDDDQDVLETPTINFAQLAAEQRGQEYKPQQKQQAAAVS